MEIPPFGGIRVQPTTHKRYRVIARQVATITGEVYAVSPEDAREKASQGLIYNPAQEVISLSIQSAEFHEGDDGAEVTDDEEIRRGTDAGAGRAGRWRNREFE